MQKPFAALGAVLLGLLASSCPGTGASQRIETARTAKATRSVIPVEAQLPKRGSISEYLDINSRITAERSVQVTSQGTGRCLRVLAEEGEKVKAGDVLAELDRAELEAQLRSATAQLSKLASDFFRAEQMYKEGLGAKAEYDNARFAYEQQQANVNQLQVQLSNMTVRAPISGVVTKKLVQVGQLVTSGTATYEIVDPNSFILVIDPSEQLLPRIKVGQKAKVNVDAVQAGELEATVRKINPSVDPASGTIKVTLDFDPATKAKLRDQAFARVRLVMATRENALLVPKDSIIEENARKYVFVVKDQPVDPVEGPESGGVSSERIQVAERIEVETGLEDSASTEIVSGLEDDVLVITVGQQTLKSGAEVKTTTAADEIVAKSELSAEEALAAAKAERAKGATTRARGVDF